MNCERVGEMMADYLGDELSADDRVLFDEHLSACDACSREIDELMETLDVLRHGADVPTLSVARRRHAVGWLQPFAYAAVLLVGLGIGWTIKPAPPSAPAESAPAERVDSPRLHPGWIEGALAASDHSAPRRVFARNAVRLMRAFGRE